MRRIVLVTVCLAALSGGGFAWWHFARPAPPEAVPLDERSFEEISQKEHEDWLRQLGYVD